MATNTGIINSAQNGSGANWDVTAPQTVAGQFNMLSDGSNPLMQKARSQSLDQMGARGLTNSSMAITAGDSAAYDVALGIAKQDAGTYAGAAQTNANNANAYTIATNNNTASKDINANNNATSLANTTATIAAQQELSHATQLYSNLSNLTAAASSIQSWGLNTITTIQNSDLSADAKNASIASVQTYLTDSYKIQGDWHTSAAQSIDLIFS